MLFQKLVETCGLSRLFAERSMRRACEQSGVDPRALTAKDLKKALPNVERAMQIYLEGAELQSRLREVRKLAE